MAYDTIETGLLTVIRLHADWSSANTSKGDYKVLGVGNSQAIVLQPGRIRTRSVSAAPRVIRTPWIINLELYLHFRGEIDEVFARCRTVRQTLIDHVDKYPTLNSTTGCINALITGGGEPDVIGAEGQWWRQLLTVDIEDRTVVTIAE